MNLGGIFLGGKPMIFPSVEPFFGMKKKCMQTNLGNFGEVFFGKAKQKDSEGASVEAYGNVDGK